jgi:hypothetical protein
MISEPERKKVQFEINLNKVNINRKEFIKNKEEKQKLKNLKFLYKKLIENKVEYNRTLKEINLSIINSKLPNWGNIILKHY